MNKAKLKIEVGKYYRTYGGWKALVVWKCYKSDMLEEEYQTYDVVHKPEEDGEVSQISHDYEGKATTIFSVNEPPQYGSHYPADLKEIWNVKE